MGAAFASSVQRPPLDCLNPQAQWWMAHVPRGGDGKAGNNELMFSSLCPPANVLVQQLLLPWLMAQPITTVGREGAEMFKRKWPRWSLSMVLMLLVGAGALWLFVFRDPTGLHNAAQPVTATFPAESISKVIVRAAMADSAVVITNPKSTVVEVSGIPEGGAKGYHPLDPSWRETPPHEWGLAFVAARHGDILVVSSRNEIHYIHHLYRLDNLRISVPPQITVIRQSRELTGKGDPDLAFP